MPFVPRRVQDMTPIKGSGDSEPESPPVRTPEAKKIDRSSLYRPKRVSEMTPFKSDSNSEEDDEDFNSLNVARRLTNSDFGSPNCSDTESEPPTKLPATPCDRPSVVINECRSPGLVFRNENNRNELNSGDNSGKSLQPSKIPPRNEAKKIDPEIEKLSTDYAGLGVRLLQRPRENENMVLLNRKRPITSSCKELFTNNTKPSEDVSKPAALPTVVRTLHPQKSFTPVEKTPHRSCDIQFKTPSIEYTSRRPSVLTRFPLNSTKSRSELTSEFESKKIVFTTPSTVSRPPLPPLADQSIDSSLEDSLNGVAPLDCPKESTCLDLFNAESCPPATSDDILLINGKRFLLENKIGVGGSSIVYLATKCDTEEQLAVKVVTLKGDVNIVEGYLNETKTLAKLQGDDSVIRLFEFEHVPAKYTLFMVMERGESDLYRVLNTHNGHLPLFTLMRFWNQMLRSVDYVHRCGVIHCDLKPANFLLSKGKLKLIDFGIASELPDGQTFIVKSFQAGTIDYVCPEALLDTSEARQPGESESEPKIRISTKSDVWSLGCILHLFLYHSTPLSHIKDFGLKTITLTNPNTIFTYKELPDFYPTIFLKILKRCLVYAPDDRASVAELLASPYDMIAPNSSPC